MRQTKTMLIFSAEHNQFDKQTNKNNHLWLIDVLEKLNIPYTECIGVYTYEHNGERCREMSVIIDENDFRQYKTDSFIFSVLGQESYLEVDAIGRAHLVFRDGRPRIQIGRLKEFDSPKGLDNFTYIPSTDTYWSV